MMISLPNNLQSDQKTKARVKVTTGVTVAKDYWMRPVENAMAKLGLDADNERTDCAINSLSDQSGH
jgi:hypothetical protein